MPSLRNLGILHFAFINNHFSLIILDPIYVHSVSSVVNPTRATSKKPSRLRIFVLNPTRGNLLVPLSVDFRVIPWQPRAPFLTSRFNPLGKQKKPAGRMGQLAISISKYRRLPCSTFVVLGSGCSPAVGLAKSINQRRVLDKPLPPLEQSPASQKLA
jgi:hypothetical protein